ncbi:MAG: wax ester/triacylglycerol synthase family O-acyltransferase [Nevskia sp.]|nr:wax ester/triacylglycerol synthase family O-acyltransferase [Nevskia sp.]
MKRLSPIDAAFLRMESKRTPMHVAGLLTFRLPDNAPDDYLRQLFAFMRSQPVTMAPFCQRLVHRGLWRLTPSWEDVPNIDIDYHLRHSALPYPGGERELGVLVERLHSHPMDLTRPLWECHLIEGMANRRFGIYLKTHHASMDGMGALRFIKKWLSEDPNHTNVAGPWALPPATQLEVEHDKPHSDVFRRTLELAGGQLRSTSELIQALRRMSVPKDNPEGGLLSALHTPRTLFNSAVSPQRRLATQLFELSRFKELSATSGATINDLSMAVCAGAMRRYLLELDALPETPLVASFPMGLPRADGKPGNAVAGFVCPLATNETDPRRRVEVINAVTSRTKNQLKSMSPSALDQLTLLGMAPLILGQMTGQLAKLPPFFNVVISNVVGSREKLYFRGAELEAIFPISVLFDGYALNASIVGYADKLSLGFTGCRNTVPRLQRLAVYAGEALEELERAYGLRTAEPTRNAAKTESAAKTEPRQKARKRQPS